MLKADLGDRSAGPIRTSRGWVQYAIVAACLIIAGFLIAYTCIDSFQDNVRQWAGIAPAALPKDFYTRFDIQPLPRAVVDRSPASEHVATLLREPCDWDATYAFAVDLQKAGYSREAAKVFTTFSEKCRPSDVALYSAADMLYGLSDLPAAIKISDELITIAPDLAQPYYLRAQVFHDAKRDKEAIDAFQTLLGLTADLSSLNSEVFRKMSLSYAALGQFCEAMTPIQTWISLNPAKNDSPTWQALIQNYSSKGNCEGSYASGKDHFATYGRDVIVVTAVVNGVRGRFIVDTGASVVSMTQHFADAAKIPMSGGFSVRVQTANGVSTAEPSSAGKIQVGHVEADDVAAVVLSGDNKPLGDGIDGLLGRSFLSRFDVTFGAKEWRIEAKNEAHSSG
ncbi:aspartyl protease family protein [Rhizobium sp. BK376]|uniref:aspartyl protease family protein n=1 Tax=Rhizobium sp. BK376 TaxID=2512149 RepID=UPI00104B1DDB|nr:aspartyl protease family protein [Rhizobium sp. BK376]TCR90958.1 aspartyl protease family protein [Rhizobium sp. BK376]